MARPPVRIKVVITDDKPTLISSDFVPTTGSVGAAATAIAADTAVTASFATTASFAISASFADTASLIKSATFATLAETASFALKAGALDGDATGTFTGTFIGDGTGLTGIVAQSTQSTADTASFVAGANVAGAVDSASFAQLAAQVSASNLVGNPATASLALGITGSDVVGPVELANTASFVTGSDVVGTVALAVSASDVAYDDVRDKPPLISSSIQITGQLDVTGVTGSFTGTFIGDGSGLSGVDADTAETASFIAGGNVDGAVELSNTASFVEGTNVSGPVEISNTASFVAGANVDGIVASASDVAYDDVRDKPTLVSSSAQFSSSDDFIVGQVNAIGVTGSFVGSFVGSGADITGIVLADSATLALGITGSNVVGAVGLSDTASYVAGGNVDGAVSLADTASFVAGANVDGAVAVLDGEATGTLTGSFIGGINLTTQSDMSGSTFAHQLAAISGATGDFTISLNDNQLQQFEISASLGFFVEGGSVGGFYGIHFINQGGNVVTWPPDMKFHSGSAITSSIASGTLDIYTIHRLPDGTYVTAIFGQSIA